MTPQQLKNSILQRAIEGRLVEQRAEEGTAKELLTTIDEYNAEIRPIKDELNFSSMEFCIPENWEWVELNRIVKFVDYRGKTPTKISKGIFLITASNIKNGYMDYTRKEYISEQEYASRRDRGITESGDILFTTEAPMGNCALNNLDKCSCGQRIITLKNHKKDSLNLKLVMYFLLSPAFQRELLDNCTGTTTKGIKAAKLKHFRLPLPPLSEQNRIVAKIEELLPLIDQYTQAHTKLTDLNTRFPSALKKSLLQYAIQGKLVEQRADEGTAQDLIKEIQAEKKRLLAEKKIKKSKPLSPITEEEIPFDIPTGWEWVRLGDIGCLERGSGLKRSEITSEGKPCIRYSELYTTYQTRFTETVSHTSEEVFESCHIVNQGEIVMALTGENKKDIAMAVTYEGQEEIAMGGDMTKWFAHGMNPLYLTYLLNSPYGITCKQSLATGNIIVHISNEKLSNIPLPIPPLAEQHRIVAKLEELLPLCDKLGNEATKS